MFLVVDKLAVNWKQSLRVAKTTSSYSTLNNIHELIDDFQFYCQQ